MTWINFTPLPKTNRGAKYKVKVTESFNLRKSFAMANPEIPCYVIDSLGTKYVEFSDGDPQKIKLYAGYGWNGSNIVPDVPACRRASAVHDALCELMDNKCLINNHQNWKAGAKVYRKFCKEDGMNLFRRNLRYVGIRVYGRLKYISK